MRTVAADRDEGLHSDPDTGRITWEFKPASDGDSDSSDDGWRPTILMDRVLDYLSRNPEPLAA